MTLVRRYHSDGRLDRVLLTECPACRADLTAVKHTSEHIESHRPEDFGLSPLGTVEATGRQEVPA